MKILIMCFLKSKRLLFLLADDALILELDRSIVVPDMLSFYEVPEVTLRQVHIVFKDESGSDFGGLTKEAYTVFGNAVLPDYFRGEDLLVPFLPLHRVRKDKANFKIIGRIGQFGNNVLESERKLRLTASLFGRVKKIPYTSCHNLLKACLHSCHFYSEATESGIAKEKVAAGLFEQQTKRKVHESGLWIGLYHGFLGASPDGLIGEDVLLEVKCLYSATKLTLETNTIEEVVDIMKSKLCLEKYDNGIRLKRNYSYYYQVQGQLNVTNRSKCYFVVYINDKINLFIEEIERNSEFCEVESVKIRLTF